MMLQTLLLPSYRPRYLLRSRQCYGSIVQFCRFFHRQVYHRGFGIANTVSKTVIEEYITLPIILSGVVASIIWNLYTWWKGIPSSSSHTLIGGFAGAAIMANGFGAIQTSIILKIIAFIFLAPLIGMVVAFGFTLLVLHICRRMHPHTASTGSRNCSLYLRHCSASATGSTIPRK